MKKKRQGSLEGLTSKLKKIKAENIMTPNVISTTRAKPLSDIAEVMINTRISGLPVVDSKKKVVGTITSSDLFTVMDMIKTGDVNTDISRKTNYTTVGFAMSSEVVTVTRKTSLDQIIVLMKYKNAHTIPVVEKGKMVGVIGRRDVFKKFYSVVKDLYK